MSCGVGCRLGSDPALLWLWRRLAATAPIRPLAWESPYAAGAAQRNSKKKKRKARRKFPWVSQTKRALRLAQLATIMPATFLIHSSAPASVSTHTNSQQSGPWKMASSWFDSDAVWFVAPASVGTQVILNPSESFQHSQHTTPQPGCQSTSNAEGIHLSSASFLFF